MRRRLNKKFSAPFCHCHMGINYLHLSADFESEEEDDSVLDNAVAKQAVKRGAPGVSKMMQVRMLSLCSKLIF